MEREIEATSVPEVEAKTINSGMSKDLSGWQGVHMEYNGFRAKGVV